MNETSISKIKKILNDIPKEEWLSSTDVIENLIKSESSERTSNHWDSFTKKIAELYDSKKKRIFFTNRIGPEVSREELDEWVNSDDRYSIKHQLGGVPNPYSDINTQYDIFLKYYKDICSLKRFIKFDGSVVLYRREDRFGWNFGIHSRVETDLSTTEYRLSATTLLYEGWNVELKKPKHRQDRKDAFDDFI